jgi:hypothetical protein
LTFCSPVYHQRHDSIFVSAVNLRYDHSTFCLVLHRRYHHSTFCVDIPSSDFFSGHRPCTTSFLTDSAVASLAFARGLASSRTARCTFLKEKGPCSGVKSVVLVHRFAPRRHRPLPEACGCELWTSAIGYTGAGHGEQSGGHQMRPKPPSPTGGRLTRTEVWCRVGQRKPRRHSQPAETRHQVPR